jgi:hypothetical protein
MAVLVWLASRSHRTPWVPAIRTGNLTGRSRPAGAQWARFLRNHDEIDLSRLTADQRADVFAALGPEPEMQLYGPGIRRRLAPMLGGDRRWTWLACSLQFTLRGPPVLRYGGRARHRRRPGAARSRRHPYPDAVLNHSGRRVLRLT